MTNPAFNIERIDGPPVQIKITIGQESLVLDEEAAHTFGHLIMVNAEMSSSLDHIDQVFDNWGEGGGTC